MASVKGGGSAKAKGGRGMPVAEMEQVFRRYDANGDGKISAEELASVLRALGAPPGPGEVRRMMDEMDSDRDGFVDLAEFVAFHCSSNGEEEGDGSRVEDATEADLREAFRMYEENARPDSGARKVTVDRQEEGDDSRVEDATEADLREAFRMYDADRNGLISARELHRVLRQLGDKCSVADCSRMIRSVDADGDGSVNFDEFKKMMGAGAGGKR